MTLLTKIKGHYLSLNFNETNYSAFVRGGESGAVRNSSVKLNSELSNTGELIVFMVLLVSHITLPANYTTKWDPNHYFPEQLDQKLNAEASSLYGVSSYENLGELKIIVRNNVEGSNWTRDLTVNQSKSDGTSTLEINHKENWRRLNIYSLGKSF